jgi:hypothetical protein
MLWENFFRGRVSSRFNLLKPVLRLSKKLLNIVVHQVGIAVKLYINMPWRCAHH